MQKTVIMLDKSPAHIEKMREKYGDVICQLRTPGTGNRKAGTVWGLDNGCFSRWMPEKWERMVGEVDEMCRFVTLPDVVGSARRTMELFNIFRDKVPQKRCLVLQNGIEDMDIPWRDIDAVFVGGDDVFKFSPGCFAICRAANILGKWVHFGRINTVDRVERCMEYADSIDGSGISMYDHMIDAVARFLNGERPSDDLPLGS